MVSRLAVFSFYDKEGKADLYIDYLLEELKTVANRLIIVVNGDINSGSYKRLTRFTEDIIVRENKGFDAGAYAYILINYLKKEELNKWDELILCNDTFYGPFISMKEIFSAMSEKKVDFWGLNLVERKLLGYVESYFLVFRKSVFAEKAFSDYVNKSINLEEEKLENVYAVLEAGLFHYLTKNGYSYDTFVNVELHDVYRNAYTCMQKYGLPILKKKAMSLKYNNVLSMLKSLRYIMETTNYPVYTIIENAKRQYEFSGNLEDVKCQTDKYCENECKISDAIISEEYLLNWVKNTPFYIYGEGVIARQLYKVYFENNSNFLGFVVSSDQEITEHEVLGYSVVLAEEIDVSAKLIVGVGKDFTKEIQSILGFGENILYLWKTE